MSIGKSLSLRDLLQAVWRLRELDRSQKVRFIVDEDARKHIQKELGLSEETVIGLKEILKYVKRNESRDLVGHLLTATSQRLRHVAKEAVNTALINPNGKFDTIRSSAEEITPLISEALADVPFDLFGKGEKEILKKIYFQRAIDQTLTRLKPLLQNEIFQSLDLKALEEQLWKEIPLELFPDMIKGSDASPADQLMESEQLQEKEDEQQKEKETYQEREESSVGTSQQMRRILEQKWSLSPESLATGKRIGKDWKGWKSFLRIIFFVNGQRNWFFTLRAS